MQKGRLLIALTFIIYVTICLVCCETNIHPGKYFVRSSDARSNSLKYNVFYHKNPLSWEYDTKGVVRAVSISNNGEYIVCGGYDYAIHLFRNNSEQIWAFYDPLPFVSVDISNSGEIIAGGSLNNRTYIFKRDSSSPYLNITVVGGTRILDLSSDGKYIFIASHLKHLGLYRTNQTENFTIFEALMFNNIMDLKISDEYYCISGDDGGYLTLHNISGSMWNFKAESGINSVDLLADGSLIVVGTSEGHIYFLSKASNTSLWELNFTGIIHAVALSPTGEYVAVGTSEGELFLVSVSNRSIVWNFHAKDRIMSLKFSDIGSHLIVGSYDYKVYYFELSSNTPLFEFKANGYITSVDITSDGSFGVAGSTDGCIYYLDFRDADNDGLSDGYEKNIAHTDLMNPDTDGDGLSDGYEVLVSFTNPLSWDTDGDGFSDGSEVEFGSDPLNNFDNIRSRIVTIVAIVLAALGVFIYFKFYRRKKTFKGRSLQRTIKRRA